MSTWGKLEKLTLTGTVSVANGNRGVTGTGTAFLNEVRVGNYFVVGNVGVARHYVANIISNTSLNLSNVFSGPTNGTAKANIMQGPAFVYSTANANVMYTIQRVYGVNRVEANVPGNKANGFSHSGWNHSIGYVDGYGRRRRKTEVLVAMSKNFNANVISGNLFADSDDNDMVAQ